MTKQEPWNGATRLVCKETQDYEQWNRDIGRLRREAVEDAPENPEGYLARNLQEYVVDGTGVEQPQEATLERDLLKWALEMVQWGRLAAFILRNEEFYPEPDEEEGDG